MQRRARSRLAAAAADAVVVLHVAVGIFTLTGAFLVPFAPWLVWVHLPLALWVGIVYLARWTCPLTPVEKRFRRLAGQQPYSTSWTRHYFGPLIERLGLAQRLELVAGASILAWNAVAYAWILWGAG